MLNQDNDPPPAPLPKIGRPFLDPNLAELMTFALFRGAEGSYDLQAFVVM